MTIRDLNRDQLDELKSSYFWGDDYNPTITTEAGLPVLFPEDIPDRVMFRVFAGVYFVPDDFATSAAPPYYGTLFDSDEAEWEYTQTAHRA